MYRVVLVDMQRVLGLNSGSHDSTSLGPIDTLFGSLKFRCFHITAGRIKVLVVC